MNVGKKQALTSEINVSVMATEARQEPAVLTQKRRIPSIY
jgi:hypothetical protein